METTSLAEKALLKPNFLSIKLHGLMDKSMALVSNISSPYLKFITIPRC